MKTVHVLLKRRAGSSKLVWNQVFSSADLKEVTEEYNRRVEATKKTGMNTLYVLASIVGSNRPDALTRVVSRTKAMVMTREDI